MGTRILKCIEMLHLLQFTRQEFVASKHTMMPYTGKPALRGNKLAGKRLVPCRASGGNKGAKSIGQENLRRLRRTPSQHHCTIIWKTAGFLLKTGGARYQGCSTFRRKTSWWVSQLFKLSLQGMPQLQLSTPHSPPPPTNPWLHRPTGPTETT